MSAESRPWFILALAVAFAWLIYLLAPVITPFAISAGLAYLGDPLVDRLERIRVFRWNLSRTVAVVIVFILMLAAFTLILLIVIPLLRDQVQRLIVKAPEMLDWLVTTALPWVQVRLGLESLVPDPQSVLTALQQYWKEASSAAFGVLGSVSRGGQAILQWIMNLVLIPVVTFYLLRDWDRLVAGVKASLPMHIQPKAGRLWGEIDDVLGAFIRGQLMVMVALGLIYSIGLWLVGLDLAVIIGMGAGLLSIVPYLGTFVGVVAAVIAVLFQFQDVLHTVLVLIVFAVGQSLEGMVLTPKLVGDRVGLHPVAVIFAVLAGGQLFGFLGILLALPVASALNVVVRHLDDWYRGSDWYGSAGEQREEG
ncbi:MAG: AI-2E family transporter [Xanthomonadales bacterium]|nr:AI-2E family transporter [Gammaproteobacteria bacterium]NNJ65710.1 AI-2E family transporter [Xanthomonadales bacterium]NNK32376.1 AI-2E family transporter [Xanthomonadales bacterium]